MTGISPDCINLEITETATAEASQKLLDNIQLLKGIDKLAGDKKVIFPIHPRTKAILGETNLDLKNILFVEPQGYLNFMYLIKNSFAVITDSGGISEETTVMGIPCLRCETTLKDPKHRPLEPILWWELL